MLFTSSTNPNSPSFSEILLTRALKGAKTGAWAGASFVLFANSQASRALDMPHNTENQPISLCKLAPTVIIASAALGAVLNVFMGAVLKEDAPGGALARKD